MAIIYDINARKYVIYNDTTVKQVFSSTWNMLLRENYALKIYAVKFRSINNLGIVPRRRGSYSVACRRALAKALKVASIM